MPTLFRDEELHARLTKDEDVRLHNRFDRVMAYAIAYQMKSKRLNMQPDYELRGLEA